LNFALFLELRARGAPEVLAAADARHRLTYAELDDAVNRFANVLWRSGIARGERLALYLPNRVETVIALLAGMKAGIIVVPLNWRLQGPDLARVLGHCAAACLVTTDDKAPLVEPLPANVFTVGEAPSTGSFWSAIQASEPRFESVACQSADIANLLYTSGTTSVPKAAIHTHGMRLAIAAAMADCFRLSSRDVGLAISPLFHTSGLSVLANCIFVGCPLILLEKWEIGAFLDTIATERVTFMHLIGTIVVDIARAPEALFSRDTRSVRFVWGGGHSLDPAMLETFERRIGVFLQGYSRTEGGLTYNPLDRNRRRFDNNGYPNRNSSEVAVIDPPTQQPCASGVTGEIAVRGDGVSPGYWDGDFVRSRTPYDGGWQPTGDLGYFDDTGALHFLGRTDHMIKTGGENVYPSEVEAALLAMPEVADAVVLGVPDGRLGHRVAALVVRGDPGVSSGDIERHCRTVLAGFKIPRTIAFAGELPRLATQKVDLVACRRMLESAAGAETSPVNRSR
jgi:acyl-CoA synthetase (AMP-forming)/AMP-acid ligase II